MSHRIVWYRGSLPDLTYTRIFSRTRTELSGQANFRRFSRAARAIPVWANVPRDLGGRDRRVTECTLGVRSAVAVAIGPQAHQTE